MSEFERQMPSFRLAETHHGDTLQKVAAREMGDANRWAELIWINNLLFPYLTDDPQRASEHVLLAGSLIRIPAPVGVYTQEADRGQVYERDAHLVNKRLTFDEGGDLAIVAGEANFKQQLLHRVVTPRGQLSRHPEYGCLVWRLHGTVNGPVAGSLAARYVRAALQAEYRVSSVPKCTAEVSGDVIRVSATANGIAGGSVDITNLPLMS
jgi:phage baseplate assembly protein W